MNRPPSESEGLALLRALREQLRVRALEAAKEPHRGRWRTLLYVLVLAAFVAGVVHPLRRYVVEPHRQALLGHVEPPGRRLAMASQFGFTTARGATVRLVPGAPALAISDMPMEAVTLILGGFRGPYVVWLWIKAEEEKQKRVHFDLIDRYTKIAALQSDYPAMWTFHAWNMAWNIPAQWQSLDRKYQWIRRGSDFLAEGYRRNPHNADIMAEMGRIYGEKLGRSQEAPYYRRRVQEDEGRSTFLIAYEWYDRARKANERYGTLERSLAPAVIYSQACHNLSYYAKELAQEMYDAFQESVDARKAGKKAEAREAFARGQQKLNACIGAWQWSRREWQEQALRYGKASAMLGEVYQRFFVEADESLQQMEALAKGLTYDNLPERFSQMHRPEIN